MNKQATTGNHGENVRSDCRVTLKMAKSGGIQVRLESKVERLFGNAIRAQAKEVLRGLGIPHAHVEIYDSGALPFVISARLEAAARQLTGNQEEILPGMIGQNLYETGRERHRVSRLYLPGNTPSMMINAGIHGPDGIILDLEDSVAPDRKPEARLLVRNALRQVDFYGAEHMVRINQLPMGLEDLEYVVPHQVHVILIPKCEHPEQVLDVDAKVREILRQQGQQREIFLMPILESCLGVEHAFSIASAADSVVAMAIGLEDLTADLGVARTREGDESLYARSRMVNACRAAGIQAIDSVFSDVADEEGLRIAVARSRALGFEGMGCIHPRQIRLILEGFAPGQEEIEKAERIIGAFREAGEKGLGVVALGSKMIDPPVVKRAERTLELAGKLKRV